WFERYGAPAVFFSRMLPIVRTFISLPAGVARMPFWRFTVLTVLGCIPWVFALTFAGKQAADHWTDWRDSLHYVDYAVAVLIVLGIVYLIVRRRRRPANAPAGASALAGAGTRRVARAGRAPPDLVVRPHGARAVAAGLVLRRAG